MPTIWSALPAVALLLMPVLDGRWLDDSAIVGAFSGRTIEGQYATGLAFVESYGTDGRVDYREPARRLGGRWSVVAGTFCTIYDDDVSGGCFRVQQTSVNCFEFFIAARTEEDAAEDPDAKGWVARGWRTDFPNSCEPAAAS